MSWLKKAAPYIGVGVAGVAIGLYVATTSVGATILGAVGLGPTPPAKVS